MQRYEARLHRAGRYEPKPSVGLAIAVAAGLVLVGSGLVGSSALQRRRDRQLRRLSEFPDSAPARAHLATPERRTLVGHAVTINRPRAELYAFWRDFANLPTFMSNVEKVVQGEPGRSVWTIAAPGGFTVDLDTEITEEREGERIAWRTLPGSDVEAEGSVDFRDAPGGRGTIVEAEIAYRPPGGEIGRWIAKLFQREPSIQGRRELKRFKMLMETGEIATSANRKSS
jgi:uncharacterized membrane protein